MEPRKYGAETEGKQEILVQAWGEMGGNRGISRIIQSEHGGNRRNQGNLAANLWQGLYAKQM